jgi:hypothetical protein
MANTWIDQLGEWNPQLFREIKGRLRPRNILISVTVSLVGQLLLLMSFEAHLPDMPEKGENYIPVSNRYCTGNVPYPDVNPLCSLVGDNSFEINWHLWCQDVFVWLSIIGIFALLVGGTYMLVNDLSKEEERGTLNFLRLTPQSGSSLLIGKLLGVPILLYFVVFLALPLLLATGLFGQISLTPILGFYGVVGASCVFFYSFALLFGLVGNWLGSFQAWLGSGTLLVFLFAMTKEIINGTTIIHIPPTNWVVVFNPSIVLSYLMAGSSFKVATLFQVHDIEQLQWFFLPVGASFWSVAGLMVLNFGLWTYWIWQGLQRCFHNPTATLLGKQQSYWLTACFEVVLLGFALNPDVVTSRSSPKGLFENFEIMLVFNLLLFLCLIAALSPQRQAMQDWARYRRHNMRSSRKRSVLQDLIWGEKSPALVAVVLNLAIASSILLPWILLWPESEYKIPALWGLLVSSSLILVYAAVAQLILFMKTPKRAVWAAGSVGGLIVIPLIIFHVLSLNPEKAPVIFLFSALPQVSVEYAAAISVFLAVMGQSLAFGLLSLQLTRQLQKAGESSTKALLSGRSSALID